MSALRTMSPTDLPAPAMSETFDRIPSPVVEEEQERPRKRVRFTETIKVQDYEICPYDIPFHEQPRRGVLASYVDEDDSSVPPIPDLDEYELLIEDPIPERVVPMKTFDGELNIQRAVTALARMAAVFPMPGFLPVVSIMQLDSLDSDAASEKLRTVHDKLVDMEAALKSGENVAYAGPKANPLKPDRLEPLQVVLKQLRTLCDNRGVVLNKE